MSISIIIPTTRPVWKLNKLINQILIQENKIEIIIVHQGLKNNTNLINDKRIKLINIFKKNLSIAKNIGIQKAKYQAIAIMDDDITLSKKYLSIGKNTMNRKKKFSLIFGSIHTKNNKKLSYNMLSKDSKINYSNFLSCLASSMWINKNKFRYKKKLFDEKFGLGGKYGSGEETDLILNTLNEKKYIFYKYNLKIYHPDISKKNKEYLNYAIGNGAIYRKFSDKKKLLSYILFLKSIIFSFLLMSFNIMFLNKDRTYKYLYFLIGRIIGFLKYRKM